MIETRTENGKVYAKLDSLKKFDLNPRVRTDEDYDALKRKIVRLGIFKDLFVTADGIILGGNQRYDAVSDLNQNTFPYTDDTGQAQLADLRGKFTEVPVTVVSFEVWEGKYRAVLNGVPQNTLFTSPEQAMAEYNIADNDPAGTTDKKLLMTMLQPHIKVIPMGNYKVEVAPPVSLKTIIGNEPNKKSDEDDAPELSQDPPVSQVGEIYQLGRHRLMCGDSTILENVQKLMNGKKADMVFTDPPYGVDYSSRVDEERRKGWGAIENDNLKGKELQEFLKDSLSYFDCPKYICCNWQSVVDFWSAFGKPNAFIVWDKGSIGLGTGYRNQHEIILFYGKISDNDQSNIWRLKRDSTAEYTHPTQKPVELSSRAIRNTIKAEQLVVDVFGGSGGTIIAAEQTDRICYMMELDPKYCDVIRKRYAKFIGQEDNWQGITPKIEEPVSSEDTVVTPA